MQDATMKADIRQAITECLWTLRADEHRRHAYHNPSFLRDARLWHHFSRHDGLKSITRAQCAAWAILYRAAYAGRIPSWDDSHIS